MHAWKKLMMSAATAVIVVASVGIAAPAQAVEVSVSDSVETVKVVTAKAPGTLASDVAVKKQRVMVGTMKVDDAAQPLVATVSADDVENSVVASAKDSQSMVVVINKGIYSAEFSLTIPEGYVAEVAADGGVQLRNPGTRVIIPFIKAPWALDSNGKKLSTFYSVNGSKVTQHVNTAGAAFPVVADPSLQWVPYPVIALWGAEIKVFNSIAVALMAGGAWAGCTFSKLTGVAAKIVSQICTVVGVGGVAGVVNAVASTWAPSNINNTTCYGVTLFNPRANLRIQPARDCY